MCAEPAPALDMDAVHAFAFKLLGDVTATQMGTLSVIADRLGLCEHLAEGGPATSAEFAARAGINERYAREWLSAMACHGYVAYDDATKHFPMPPEQAFVLVDADSPFYLGSLFADGAALLAQPRPADRGVQARRRGAAGALTATSSGAASSASPAPASATTSRRTGSPPCPRPTRR